MMPSEIYLVQGTRALKTVSVLQPPVLPQDTVDVIASEQNVKMLATLLTCLVLLSLNCLILSSE
jgi:hypothetical protein